MWLIVIVGLLVMIAWNTTDDAVKGEVKSCASNIKQIHKLRIHKPDQKEAS